MLAVSTSVMPTLGQPAPEAIAAMQAMNSAILKPAYGLAFSGAALLCGRTSGHHAFTVDESHTLLRGLGAALHLVGTLGVTMAITVPMNVQLHAAHAGSERASPVSPMPPPADGMEHASHDPGGRRLGTVGDLARMNRVGPHAPV